MTPTYATLLTQFNTRCFDAFGQLRYENPLRVGTYTVFFAGWMPVADSTIIVGRWFGWPQQPLSLLMVPRWFVSQVVPASDQPIVQEYQPGDTFQISNRVYAEYLLDPQQQLHLLMWALQAKDALIEHLTKREIG